MQPGKDKYAYLHDLSTQELRCLLRRDLEMSEKESNWELIYRVMAELEGREAHSASRPFSGVDAAMNRMHLQAKKLAPENDATSTPRKKPARLLWLRYAAAAAMLALVILGGVAIGVPRESGFDYDKAFGDVEAVLTEYGIHLPGLPQWLPRQFECTDIQVQENPVKTTVCAREEAGGQTLTLQVDQYHTDVDTQAQSLGKDSTIVYMVDGVRYYVSKEASSVRIAWTSDDLRISMEFSDPGVDTKKVIDSVEQPEGSNPGEDWRGKTGTAQQTGLVDELLPVQIQPSFNDG